jgi:hypothetical protein
MILVPLQNHPLPTEIRLEPFGGGRETDLRRYHERFAAFPRCRLGEQMARAAGVWPRYSSFNGKSAAESMILSTIFRCSAVDVPLRRRISSATRARHNVTHLGRPVLHAFVRFSVAKLLLINCKMTAHALTKQIRNFAFKRQNVFQEGFNTRPLFPHFAALQEAVGLMVNDSAFCRGRRTSIADEMREEHRRRVLAE